jgi:hypothetical protein
MSTPAGDRLGVAPAPGGLWVVQDFVNTDAGGRPDLLADAGSAQQWFAALGRPPVVLTDRDRRKLADLRVRLRAALHHRDGAAAEWIVASGVSAGLRLAGDGTVVTEPQGTGWRLVASVLLIELLRAQETNVWPRLKVCRNEACGTAFYDRSRNNSGVWHDVLVCGNAINLRASRARRRVDRLPS